MTELESGRTKQRAELRLSSLVQGGDCLARLAGEAVFVPFGIPGEDVVVEIVSRKNGYARGRIVEVITPSPFREKPRCQYFGRCGGCQLQHIAYEHQMELKQRIVTEQLQRLGGQSDVSVMPVVPSENRWGYRNQGRFGLHRGVLGFTRPRSHDFVPVDNCLIMHSAINDALAALQGQVKKHFHQVTIRYGVNTGQLLVSPALPVEPSLIETGQPSYEEKLQGHRFRVDAVSFFQVNTSQAEYMVSFVNDWLVARRPKVLLDVYCGVGSFGLSIANQIEKVIGIEDSKPSIRDARFNSIGNDNVIFIKGAAEKVLPELNERVDAVILDPPRAGCRPEVIEALTKLQPANVVYVSCDPATLARDLRLFSAAAYRVEAVQPFDMFPQTQHVEIVVLMSRATS